MGIEEIKAPRRPARDSLVDALTAREAFQPPAAAGQAMVLIWARSLPRLR